MYCSGLCRKVDEQRHAAACGVVSRAKQVRWFETAYQQCMLSPWCSLLPDGLVSLQLLINEHVPSNILFGHILTMSICCLIHPHILQRYAPPEPPPPGQQQSDPRVCEPSLGWMARLLQSLPGEGDSLSVCCGGIYNVGPAVLPKRIIVEQHK